MSLGSVQGRTAAARFGYPSTIAPIGVGGRDSGSPDGVAAILFRFPGAARKAYDRDRDGSFANPTRVSSPHRAQPAARGNVPVTPARGGLAPWQVLRVEAYVEANLHSTVRARDLAAIARLSSGHFSRAFKRSLGQSPLAYIARRRVACAQDLMLTTNAPLCQIALDCGFYDQSHLTRVFHRYAAASPHDWRRRHRDDAAPIAASPQAIPRHRFDVRGNGSIAAGIAARP
jgi:AraC family transcriptional regulator